MVSKERQLWYFLQISCFPYMQSSGEREYSMIIFSSPGQSPGRAIVLPLALALASALAKSLMLSFFMWWARRCQASYPVPVTGLVLISYRNHML